MSAGLGTAIIAMIVMIAVIVIFAGILPHEYNKGVESKQANTNYCQQLYNSISIDKAKNIDSQIVINEENNYKEACSS
jgi:ABC-type bacteriocin/lantibiotic exporter with double-glycine peptidase domain